MDVEDLVRDLDQHQREAVLSGAAPLCVVAPPGSGKTRVLTRRIARRVVDGTADEPHVVAITFTRRAAGELRRRLQELGLHNGAWTGTFHALALRLLRQRDADLSRRSPTLVGHRYRLVEEVAPPGTAAELLAEIDWASAQQLDAAAYAGAARRASRRLSVPAGRVAQAIDAYADLKRQRRVVDFDDLLRGILREVRRDPAYAAALRWRLRHLFVDEFQDVNPLQHAFLVALLGERTDLFVVGDPDQAIYGWNGADATWLGDFAEHHPGATVLHLRASHRSSPQVLSLASQVLGRPTIDLPVATRPEGPEPRYHRAADDVAEARTIAALVRDARVPGRPWSAIAVLARTNAQLATIADALHDAGVPVRRRTGPAGLALLEELRDPPGAGRRDAGPRRGEVRRWLADREDPLPADLAAAVEDALAEDPDLDLATLRTTLAAEPRVPGGGGVALLTFHAAKGLEWPVVVIAGAAKGLVPHAGATTPAARAEERRLLYVALTRAERELHVTWAGRPEDRSPFLPDLPETVPAPPPERLRRPARPADPVLTALEAWRRRAARAARVDEQLVCSDEELARLAARPPTTVDDVAEVLGPLSARRLGPRVLEAVRSAGLAPGAGTPPGRRR